MTDSLYLPAARLRPAAITLPGSKSISNRTLLLAALSDNACRIENLLDADDTRHMLAALQSLGVRIEHHGGGSYTVHGCGGRFPQRQADLFLGNAGTAFRPLTAALALLGGDLLPPGLQPRLVMSQSQVLQQSGAHRRTWTRSAPPWSPTRF